MPSHDQREILPTAIVGNLHIDPSQLPIPLVFRGVFGADGPLVFRGLWGNTGDQTP